MIFELKDHGEFVPKSWPSGNRDKPEDERVWLEYVFPTGRQLDGYTSVITRATTKQALAVADGEDPETAMSWETKQDNDRIFRDCVKQIHGIIVREDGQEREISSPATLLKMRDSIGYHRLVSEFGNFILSSSRIEEGERKNS
jgi:hypothetical protein